MNDAPKSFEAQWKINIPLAASLRNLFNFFNVRRVCILHNFQNKH
jgi:hypothetical protein